MTPHITIAQRIMLSYPLTNQIPQHLIRKSMKRYKAAMNRQPQKSGVLTSRLTYMNPPHHRASLTKTEHSKALCRNSFPQIP
jgi:hypothetical protein